MDIVGLALKRFVSKTKGLLQFVETKLSPSTNTAPPSPAAELLLNSMPEMVTVPLMTAVEPPSSA